MMFRGEATMEAGIASGGSRLRTCPGGIQGVTPVTLKSTAVDP